MTTFERAWRIVKSRDWRSEGRDALEDLFDWDWGDHDLHPWDGSPTEGSWRQVKPTGNWVWKRPRPDNEQPRKSGLSSDQLHLDTDPAWILYQSGYPIMPELTDPANSYPDHWADIPITVQPRGRQTQDQIEALRYQQGGTADDYDLSETNDILTLPEVALSPYYRDLTAYNIADFSRNPLIGDKGVRGAHSDEKYKYIFDAVQEFNDLLGRDARIEESVARIPYQDMENPPSFDHPHSEVLERINNQLGFYEGDEMRIDEIGMLEDMRDIAEGLEEWGF